MATPVPFALFDVDGALLNGAFPVVRTYRRSDGSVLAPPVVVERGGGFYEFEADEASGGSAYLIDAGPDSSVRYLAGSVGRLVAFALYDASGEPQGSRSPAFLTYVDPAGAPLAQPTIRSLGGGLYGFTPATGTQVRYVVADDDALWGVIGLEGGGTGPTPPSSPIVSGMTPAEGTAIAVTQEISFDVLDEHTDLGRVLIAIQYENYGGATELIWDGDQAVGPHLVSSIPLLNGRRYTVLREGGWAGPFTLRIFATNLAGREL